jgi:hypothetical protein
MEGEPTDDYSGTETYNIESELEGVSAKISKALHHKDDLCDEMKDRLGDCYKAENE